MGTDLALASNMEIEERLGVPIWTRRDGTQVALSQMQDRHIQNSIAILIPWRRDCKARGEREMARTLNDTIAMFRREERRRRRMKRG